MPSVRDELRITLTGQAAMLNELAMAYIEPTLRQGGLNWGTFELISAVHAANGQAKQSELADRLGITPPSLCEALKTAVKKGFLEQVTSETDQRAKIVRLTNEGKQILDQALQTIAQMESRLKDSLDSQRVSEAIALLTDANRVLASAIHSRDLQQNR
jgi:DNA-binding MarR family transcriptional regulator